MALAGFWSFVMMCCKNRQTHRCRWWSCQIPWHRDPWRVPLALFQPLQPWARLGRQSSLFTYGKPMCWQRGVPLSPRLSGQNLRAVQLQIRYIGKLLPRGLKTWLKSFFSFFKVFFSTSFRNVSCPQWKTPQNINNHKKTESRVFATSSTGKKKQENVFYSSGYYTCH